MVAPIEQVAPAEQGIRRGDLAQEGLADEAREEGRAAARRQPARPGLGPGLCQQQPEIERRAEQIELGRAA